MVNRGIFYLIMAIVLWSGNYICGRFLADALPPHLLNTIRWVISTIILFAILFYKKKRIRLILNWKEFLISGFFGIFIFSTLLYWGLNYLTASQVGMITAFTPISILLFAIVLLRENISRQGLIGTVISVIGVFILFLGKSNAEEAGSWFGGILIILASLSWGIYTALSKKYSNKFDPLTFITGASFYGAILSAISCIGTVRVEHIQMTLETWLAVVYVSTLASVVAFIAWQIGVQQVGAGYSAPFMNLMPVCTLLFGIILLNETVTIISLIGGSISIVGALLASFPKPITERFLTQKRSEKL